MPDPEGKKFDDGVVSELSKVYIRSEAIGGKIMDSKDKDFFGFGLILGIIILILNFVLVKWVRNFIDPLWVWLALDLTILILAYKLTKNKWMVIGMFLSLTIIYSMLYLAYDFITSA